MPVPQLNTAGNDVTNTVSAISRINNVDAATEGQKSHNKLLDLQLSPEMQAHLKAQRAANLANTNALVVQRNMENSKAAALQVKEQLGSVRARMESEGITPYQEFYDRVLENPLTREHAASLPTPSDYMKRDIRVGPQGSGKSVTKDGLDKLMGILSNRITAADRKAQGLEVQYKTVYFPDGTSDIAAITPAEEGKLIDAEKLTGITGASFTPVKSKVDKDLEREKFEETKRANEARKAKAAAPTETTEAQDRDDERADTKLMRTIDKDFSKEDKDGKLPFEATDEDAGKQWAADYNSLAIRHGKNSRYVWRDDALEVPVDRKGLGNALDVLSKAGEFITGKEETEKIGGWVKIDISGDNTVEEIEGMKPGEQYTWYGQTYTRQ